MSKTPSNNALFQHASFDPLVSHVVRAANREKAAFMFDMFDFEGRGEISYDELAICISTAVGALSKVRGWHHAVLLCVIHENRVRSMHPRPSPETWEWLPGKKRQQHANYTSVRRCTITLFWLKVGREAAPLATMDSRCCFPTENRDQWSTSEVKSCTNHYTKLCKLTLRITHTAAGRHLLLARFVGRAAFWTKMASISWPMTPMSSPQGTPRHIVTILPSQDYLIRTFSHVHTSRTFRISRLSSP